MRLIRKFYRSWHRAIRLVACAIALVALAFGVNWIYQIVRKPAELFFPVSGVLSKTPADAYVRRGFRLAAGQRCGDHDVRGYLAQVNAMKRAFARFSTLGYSKS